MLTKISGLVLGGLLLAGCSSSSNTSQSEKAIQHIKDRWGHCFENYDVDYVFLAEEDNKFFSTAYTTVFAELAGSETLDFEVMLFEDGRVENNLGDSAGKWLFIEGCEERK